VSGGKRYYFPDEEPDRLPWLPYDEWKALVGTLCKHCGHDDHKHDDCPNITFQTREFP